VQHERHYTIEQARRARSWVAARVQTLRRAGRVLNSPPARAALNRLDPDDGGGWPGHAVARATIETYLALQRLGEAEVVVRDPAKGLVDFPSLRDGQEVYLCWLIDEPEISYWHAPETGFAGREPL
jgi:hypothetical protein